MLSRSNAITIPNGYLLAIIQKTGNPIRIFILSVDMVKQLTLKRAFLITMGKSQGNDSVPGIARNDRLVQNVS